VPEAAPQDESFRALPSGMLLTDLVQSARDEVIAKWRSEDQEDEYPILAQLWLYARAASRATLRKAPKDASASTLWARWNEIDTRYGEPPRSRGWLLTSIEASERQEAMMDYLYDSGLLELREAEKTSPRYWLSNKELEGE
jgi:hypothetical protein